MDFYERATLVCGQIPKGKVATYGQIALLCGKPKNARPVGYALNHGRSVDLKTDVWKNTMQEAPWLQDEYKARGI